MKRVKEKGKAELLNTFFVSFFSSRASFSLNTWNVELQNRYGKQTEALKIHQEMVSDLLHYLDIHKCVGPNGVHSGKLRKLIEVFTKPLCNIYHQS